MDFTYKPTDFELQLAVLYVIKNIKATVDAQMLSSCICSCLDTNFFSVGDATEKLRESDNISEIKVDGRDGFSLTDKGENTIEYFYKSLPFSIREKLVAACDGVNERLKIEARVIAEPVAVDDHTFLARCEIYEYGEPLFKLDLNVGGFDTAKKVCEYFKENNMEIYNKVFKVMFNEEDK